MWGMTAAYRNEDVIGPRVSLILYRRGVGRNERMSHEYDRYFDINATVLTLPMCGLKTNTF